MQLQDAFSIPKIFIGLDIHKKAGQFLSKQIYFSQDLFDAQCWGFVSICGANISRSCCRFSFSGLLRILRGTIFLNLGWNVLVVNPQIKEGDKEAIKTDALDSKLVQSLKNRTKGVLFPQKSTNNLRPWLAIERKWLRNCDKPNHISSMLFHGIKFQTSLIIKLDYSFYCVVRRNKIQHSCGD
jgi:hypothetical protein